jgi:hypothetical protein
LLVGVLNQTHLLSVQANVLQSLSANRNPVAIGCTAQSIIDVIEGKQGKQYQPLDSSCASQNVTATGDGFGLAGSGYLAGAVEHATLAISQPDATNVMRVHARLMATALNGIKGWTNTILQDAFQIRANPSDLASVPEIEQLANDAYYGTGVTAAQQTGPAIADGGAIAAYVQGQLMATLPLNPSV